MTIIEIKPFTRERARQLRMIMGMTIAQMADHLGYDEQHYGRIERGVYPLPPDLKDKFKPLLTAHANDVLSIVRTEL